MAKITLEKVVKELKIVKVLVTSDMVIESARQSFLALTNPVTNDHWPANILNVGLHNFSVIIPTY